MTRVSTDFFDTRTRNWRARLAISAEFMRELSRYSDPHELSGVFARRMAQLFPTSRQLTLTRRGLQRPAYRLTRFNLWEETANPFTQSERFPIYHGGVLAELLYSDDPRVIDDLILAEDDPATVYLDGQRSLLSIPLYEHGSVTSVVVVTREESHAFPPEQIPELVWMTNLFGRATQTLVLTHALKEAYEAADTELQSVAELQQSLLPTRPPAVSGLDVAVHYRTAHRAGGDYYDFFELPQGKLGVLIADVSGHGTHAAVLMAICHSIAHASASPPAQPGKFLGHLNSHLAGRYGKKTGSFVTAFYAVLDPESETLTYSSAGHAPPRLVRGRGGLVPLNRAQRLPLGISPAGVDYPEQQVDLRPGDQVILFTDGVTESVDRTGDMFGTERLDEAISGPAQPADTTLRRVLLALESFTGKAPLTDDRTLLAIRCTEPILGTA
jgi:phosphoserine phosphatase RsbU/P